jgi:hypothetical protein
VKLTVLLVLVVCGALLGCGAGSRIAVTRAGETSPPRPEAGQASVDSPGLGKLQVFPPDNPWNMDISKYPVHPNSANFINSIGENNPLHPDFGPPYDGIPSGIPYALVKGNQPKVPITFEYADESDPGPYPIPNNAMIEGGPDSDGDRHVLVIDTDNKILYELFRAFKTEDGWRAGSGAIFDLKSNKLRPMGWTSCDAAGLPILPGLVRYDEVEKGEITHAIRFTARRSQRGYILPATHFASRSSDPNLAPMGLRIRLKASYDISGFPKEAQVILKALKKYGMIMADNGGDWYITGAPSPLWNDDILNTLKRVKGSDFEAVDTGPIHTD